MKIHLINVDKIKADSNQPRKSIDKRRVKEMAQSIKTEGVINPIEIDEKGIIITGEMRWRAAKESGIKEIPCKILSVYGKDRFRRQVVENIQHNTMSNYDTAVSLYKLLGNIAKSPGDLARDEYHKSDRYNKGIKELGEEIGCSKSYIFDHLDLLSASKELQKKVQEEKVPYTFIRALKRTPEKFKKELEKKIINNEFSSRDSAIAVADAISRADSKVASTIIKQDYRNRTVDQIKSEMKVLVPKASEMFDSSAEIPKKIGQLTVDIGQILKNNPPKSLGSFHLRRVVPNLVITMNTINKWLSGAEEVKELESGKGKVAKAKKK